MQLPVEKSVKFEYFRDFPEVVTIIIYNLLQQF